MENQQEFFTPYIESDTIVFGLLMASLGFIFYTSSIKKGFWKVFYTFIPALFMAYMLPAIWTSTGLIASGWGKQDELGNWEFNSKIYTIAKNYLLPSALILMTISIDLKAIANLGWRAVVMFFTGTIGIVIGGPIAILLISLVSPETVGGAGIDAVWRGLSTLAGSWIGGGANQTAMYEIYEYNSSKYVTMIMVDIIIANIWMAIILVGIGKSKRINKWLKADTSAIEDLKLKVKKIQQDNNRNPSLTDLMVMIGIAFGGTSLAHFLGKKLANYFSNIIPTESLLAFLGGNLFWLIMLSTIIAILLSFTKIRKYEGAGASKIASVFIYILVASIGMKMDLTRIFDNPGLFAVGAIWMSIHALLLIFVAKLIKAPYFFLAIGSQANVGGAASAPIVAAEFHPSLATVGVLLAVLGYAVGTIAAIGCTILMQLASPETEMALGMLCH